MTARPYSVKTDNGTNLGSYASAATAVRKALTEATRLIPYTVVGARHRDRLALLGGIVVHDRARSERILLAVPHPEPGRFAGAPDPARTTVVAAAGTGLYHPDLELPVMHADEVLLTCLAGNGPTIALNRPPLDWHGFRTPSALYAAALELDLNDLEPRLVDPQEAKLAPVRDSRPGEYAERIRRHRLHAAWLERVYPLAARLAEELRR